MRFEFKQVKLIKIFLVAGLAIYLYIVFSFVKTPIINGYTQKFSYTQNDTCLVFINDIVKTGSRKVTLKDLSGKTLSEQKIAAIRQDTAANAWRQGFGYMPSGSLHLTGLASGFYTIHDEIPLIIRPQNKTHILIVVPSVNYQCNSSAGGKSFFAHNSTAEEPAVQLSWQRPIPITEYEQKITAFAEKHLSEYTVGYITDFDLLFYPRIEHADMLWFYGSLVFVSPQMRKNIDRFTDAGGHILYTTNGTMNNIVRINLKQKRLFFPRTQEKMPNQWNNPKVSYPNYQTVGATYEKGFFFDSIHPAVSLHPAGGQFTLTNPTHPVLNDIKQLQTTSTVWNGPPLIGYDSLLHPILDTAALALHHYDLLAYTWSNYNQTRQTIGAIAVFQRKPSSGLSINMGSACWVENLPEEQSVRLLKNAFSFLLKPETK